MPEQRMFSILPDAEQFLGLDPEEVAGILIQWLNSLDVPQISRHNVGLHYPIQEYPQEHWAGLQRAVMEAWAWLEREGLVTPFPGQDGTYFVSRRGKKIATAADLGAYRHSSLLPRRQLHPIIAQKVFGLFVRGDYDVAVLQSFKEVEVRVRQAGGYSNSDLGVDLMRKAFHETTGRLTDTSVVVPERMAVSHLFAGAIGLFKNPHSHRNVSIDAEEATELIVFASHLLKTVDARAAANGLPVPP